MNRLFILFSIFLLSALYCNCFAQDTIRMNAVSTTGQFLINQSVDISVSVIQDNPHGEVVFSENHNVTTDSTGHFFFVLGQGTSKNGYIPDNQGLNSNYYYIKAESENFLVCTRLYASD